MKDIYKNPIVYYIAVPVILAIWPLLVSAVYLPGAEESLKKEIDQYEIAEEVMLEILKIDPSRLELDDSNAPSEEFDYARAIQRAASLCGISPASYKLNSGIIIKTSEKKSQNANVSLKDISIEKFANFLFTIQLHWAKLHCVRLKLTQKKGIPDTWDADLEFKYYY